MLVQRNSFVAGRSLATALSLLLTLLAGCTTPPRPVDPAGLTRSLIGLASTVDPEEADRLAGIACEYSGQLAGNYRVARPAWFHNCLVNCGLRERGLCYHWANDLEARLQLLPLRSLELHLVVARPGRWREHNAVVVTAVGQSFEQGILLDAWRYAGRLYWIPVKADKYPWQKLTRELVEAPSL